MTTQATYYLGIDLGSTTVKYALLDATGKLLAQNYVRHQSAVVDTLVYELNALSSLFPSLSVSSACSSNVDSSTHNLPYLKVNFTGSAALDLSKSLHASFVQEVIAASTFLQNAQAQVDVAIELGGEDGKIIFLTNGVELRMNEACAGGTGAFADQMAALLGVSTTELNTLASKATKVHPIASRCGVFAKTDVVALLNQGVPKSEIAKSVFDAICEQTISGLACGRPIVGNVCFLGGPLSFLTELRQSFIHKLQSPQVNFLNIEHTQYAIALGAALFLRQADLELEAQGVKSSSAPCFTLPQLISALKKCTLSAQAPSLKPLFRDLANVTQGTKSTLSTIEEISTTHAEHLAKDKSLLANSTDMPALTVYETAMSHISLSRGQQEVNESQPQALGTVSLAKDSDSEPGDFVTTVYESSEYGVNETYAEFKQRHALASVETKPLTKASGPLFLGIDLGSTTIKLVLLNAQHELLSSYYAPNGGAPLKFLLPKVQQLLEEIPEGAYLAAVCTTGYGADLAKAALNAQFTEVETLAHQRAAVAFDPKVSYVIDIGGQDMKCIQVSSGLITSIQLNEACSSGCGSFLETFASQLNLPLQEFVQQSLQASAPCDLGTRCTVFMNSKVKQAQRDNVPIGDIAAGLCLSIVRNALYKVLRIHDSSELGEHVVVQGGTFLNDAILRAFELNIGRNVIRPNIAGLMGAFGAALLAHERCTNLEVPMKFSPEQFDLSKIKAHSFRCKGCTNHCALTMNTFLSGQKYMQGNRCDFALHHADKSKESANNFCNFKNKLLFDRPVRLTAEQAQILQSSQAKTKLDSNHLEQSTVRSLNKLQATEQSKTTVSQEEKQAKAARAAELLNKARALKAAKEKKEPQEANAKVTSQASELNKGQERKLIPEHLPLEQGLATRGSIGIPRVLNMFEHYPFWHALFTELKFNVCLSPESDSKILSLGNQSIPSQSLCLPAKLTHGHITYLAQHGVKQVFLPCVPRETKQDYFNENDEYFACPVVGGYPEALRLNLESTFPDVKVYTPFLMLNTPARIIEAVQDIDPSIKSKEIKAAIAVATKAQERYRQDLEAQALEQIAKAERDNLPLMVLAGHPYHIDPFINHGIPALISSMGTCLVTEDAIAHLTKTSPELEVVNQWAFHSRLYRAAQFVIEHPHSELVQLVSFGCGIDAITSEQVKKLLQHKQRLYTMLKIDEGDTLGAAKIRLRSLLCATQDNFKAQEQVQATQVAKEQANTYGHLDPIVYKEQCVPENSAYCVAYASRDVACDSNCATCNLHFVEGVKLASDNKEHSHCATQAQGNIKPLSTALAEHCLDNRTIYMPQMAPIHFPILASCLHSLGYNVKLLEDVSEEDIEQGLKYINNDACYPAIVAIGQLLTPLVKEQINAEKSALLLAQTCGSCRATNYTALLEWALKDIRSDIPIVTLQGSSLNDSHLHLKLGLKGLKRLLIGLLYGDLLQHLYLHTKTYEIEAGASDRLLKHYHAMLNAEFLSAAHSFKRTCQKIIQDFAKIELRKEERPKVGIVGEILLKYHPVANNHVVEHIIAEGGEPVLGDITAFVLYCLHGNVYQAQTFGVDKLKGVLTWFIVKHFDRLRNVLLKLVKDSPFAAIPSFNELMNYGQRFTTLGQQAGEGWLLEAEMLDFIEHDVPNVLCLQPFACLPNHITGKGLMRTLRENYPQANLCSLDFEAGTTQSNVINRLKLFMSQAKQNLLLQMSKTTQAVASCKVDANMLTAPREILATSIKSHATGISSGLYRMQGEQTPVTSALEHGDVDKHLRSESNTSVAKREVSSNIVKVVGKSVSLSPSEVASLAANTVVDAANTVRHAASHAADSVVDAASSVRHIASYAADSVVDAASSVRSVASQAADSVVDVASQAADSVVDVASHAANSVAEAAVDVANHALAAKTSAMEVAKSASNTVSNTVTNAANYAAQAAADLVVDTTNQVVVEAASFAQGKVSDVASHATRCSKKINTKV